MEVQRTMLILSWVSSTVMVLRTGEEISLHCGTVERVLC